MLGVEYEMPYKSVMPAHEQHPLPFRVSHSGLPLSVSVTEALMCVGLEFID